VLLSGDGAAAIKYFEHLRQRMATMTAER
jgi:hypothetical protein